MELNNKYGYVRVSSKTQESNSSIESQKQQLIQNGIEEENIFVEIGSSANEIKNRSVFQKLINQKLKENDLLMVTKIDRCSRNTLEFLKLQDILFKKNIIRLLSELVENKIIQDEVEILLKSGKKRDRLIQNLIISDITRRIKYIKFYEIL